jgi:hypothetical protein
MVAKRGLLCLQLFKRCEHTDGFQVRHRPLFILDHRVPERKKGGVLTFFPQVCGIIRIREELQQLIKRNKVLKKRHIKKMVPIFDLAPADSSRTT